MKHRKFVKQLMAAGVTRNRANDILAYEARLLGIPYFKYMGQFLNNLGVTYYRLDKNMQALGLTLPGGRTGLANSMRLRPVVYMAPNNPYIKPLRSGNLDGLRADFAMVDEWDTIPLRIPVRETHKKLEFCRVGIDLAHGPDFTAGGGGND